MRACWHLGAKGELARKGCVHHDKVVEDMLGKHRLGSQVFPDL